LAYLPEISAPLHFIELRAVEFITGLVANGTNQFRHEVCEILRGFWRIERKHVTGIRRFRDADRELGQVERSDGRDAIRSKHWHVGVIQRLRAGNGIIVRSAIQPVASQSAKDDVVGERRPAGVIGNVSGDDRTDRGIGGRLNMKWKKDRTEYTIRHLTF
jgi:hypothetical protein